MTLLTGVSGSGKTTLLERARQEADFADIAVVSCAAPAAMNWAASGEMPDLTSSCLCCSASEELIGVLRDMFYQRAAGTRPFFQRVVIEARGHSDPLRMADMLTALPLASVRYALDGIVTVVDAERGAPFLDGNAAAQRQIVTADCLVVSKVDRVSKTNYQAIEQLLTSLNPRAKRYNAQDDAFHPARLFTNTLRPAQAQAA
ncbi:MAG: hypothetical protein HY255_10255 [Betaproteobacteria bacterium]|nr:hypothetical protein [Betaproteobacteria bacterium]